MKIKGLTPEARLALLRERIPIYGQNMEGIRNNLKYSPVQSPRKTRKRNFELGHLQEKRDRALREVEDLKNYLRDLKHYHMGVGTHPACMRGKERRQLFF